MPKIGDAETVQRRRTLFVENYLGNGGNATKAAIDAGVSPGSARVTACRWLKQLDIKTTLAERGKEVLAEAGLSSQRWAKEMESIAHFDPAEMYDEDGKVIPIHLLPEHVRRAIASVKGAGDTLEYKFHDKNVALANVGKHLGVFERDNNQLRPDIKVLIQLVGK